MYSSMKKKWERFRGFLMWKIDFESQILATFDTSPLHQFAKFNNFLLVCWFLDKNLSNFVSPAWKFDNPHYHNDEVAFFLFIYFFSFFQILATLFVPSVVAEPEAEPQNYTSGFVAYTNIYRFTNGALVPEVRIISDQKNLT